MNIEELRIYCLKKKGVTEEFPFNETTLVFKVMGKMFVLVSIEGDFSMSLKCDPELALELREQYASVTPGYHLNKVHWNSINIDGSVLDKKLYSWIDHSYEVVVNKLPKKSKKILKTL